ncbi:MAG: hypothetical protein KDA96_11090 [Planctomycetaceae bacterium]|nr:hypothetical protein [Planctomycetaceae bacterium]
MKIPAYWVIDLSGTEAFKGLGRNISVCIESITRLRPKHVTLTFDATQTDCIEGDSDIELLNALSEESAVADSFARNNRGVFAVLSNEQSTKLEEIFGGGTPMAVTSLCVDDTAPIRFEDGGQPFWPLFFALLQRIHACSRVILFTLNPLNFELPSDWKFDLVQLGNEDNVAEYVLTRIGRDIFNFALRVNERDQQCFVSDQDPMRGAGTHVRGLLKSEYNDWFRQEFGCLTAAQAFLRCCWDPLCRLPLPNEKEATNRTMLPLPAQIAIGVTRLCRRMSTWTLEGDPFECTVVLVGQDKEEVLKASGERFRSLIELDSPCPFNFDFEDEVRQYAEMSQGLPLMMIVSAITGRLQHIATSLLPNHSGLSHRYFKQLAGERAIVFRIRPPGKVDIFDRSALVLGFDGFQWRETPFAELEMRALQHFKRKDIQQTCTDRLIESTQRLLDNSQSSIFILVSEADRKTALDLTGESLRPSVMWPTQTWIKISEVDPAVLASTLHLDGAHLIDESGEVFAIARRIRARVDCRHQIILTRAEYDQLQPRHHCLPYGAAVQAREDQTDEMYADLVFPRRLSPSWVLDWEGEFDQKLGEGICRKIRAAVTGELVQLCYLRFDQEYTTHSLEPIRSQLRQRHIESAALKLKDKITLLLWEKDCIKEASQSTWRTKVNAAVSDLCAARGKYELKDDWFVARSIPKAAMIQPVGFSVSGLALTECGKVFVVEQMFKDVMGDANLPPGLYEELFHWDRDAAGIGGQSSGTGTRAAEEISKRLPSSVVVKVSASGRLKVFCERKGDQ